MALSIQNISKQYTNDIWGIKDFTLDIDKGILGILGPNGAGKSTLMKIISTVSKPTEGKIFWNNIDISKNPNEIRSELGYLPQDFGVYLNLNAIEFLQYIASIKGMDRKKSKERIEELIELLNLNEIARCKLSTYSGGMRQKIGIAQAIINNPKLLIIDDPTIGLDTESRIIFRNILSEIAQGVVIIIASHVVTDVETISSKIVLLSRGKLLTQCTEKELIDSVGDKVWKCIVHDEKSYEMIKTKYIITSSIRRNNRIYLRIVSENKPVKEASLIEPCLEDAYLYYIADSRKKLNIL